MDIRSLSQARALVLRTREATGEVAVLEPDPSWATEAARLVLQAMGVLCGEEVAPPDSAGGFWLSNGRELYACDETLMVGEPIEINEHFADEILEQEDEAYSAIHLYIEEQDDVDLLAEQQYMLQRPLCLSAATPELLEAALTVYDGRVLYDLSADEEIDEAFLQRMRQRYGLVLY